MPADDLVTTFLTAQAAFAERVHAVTPDQWQLGTPDAQWTVANLVGHLVDEHRWAAPLLAGLDMDAARAAVAGLGPAGGEPASSAPGTWPRPPQPRRSAPAPRWPVRSPSPGAGFRRWSTSRRWCWT